MRKTIGILSSLIALFWVWYYGQMVYDKIFQKDLIYCFRPSIWVSVANSTLGIVGLLIGIKLFKGQLKLLKAILVMFSLICIGFIIEVIG